MYSYLQSFGLVGIDGYLVTVEVDVRRGMPGFDIVGLPDIAVKESRDRVKSALQNMGYSLPTSKILVNLAPADLRKLGAVYDLPILLALLQSAGYQDLNFEGVAVIGEISLSGEIRPITGVLSMVLDAKRLGILRVIVPEANAAEACVAEDIEVFCATHAKEVVEFLAGRAMLKKAGEIPQTPKTERQEILDFSDVKGQAEAKYALEIAAAGGHNILLVGSPGAGKSMLAKRIPSILPPMTRQESIETTKIYSAAGLLPQGGGLLEERPFRSPHHTASTSALTGGGTFAKPGDISLAHNGVLFLDELPEFQKNALESLRQPLEDGLISISRVRQRVSYPSHVMLVAAMNPCKCGFAGHPTKKCSCSDIAAENYRAKISGPLLDRIDIHIEVSPVEYDQLAQKKKGETSSVIRQRVVAARERQLARFEGSGITCNANIPPALLSVYCALDAPSSQMLKGAFERLGLSARGYDRILKLARTIADMEAKDDIAVGHIAQAIQLRGFDRKYSK